MLQNLQQNDKKVLTISILLSGFILPYIWVLGFVFYRDKDLKTKLLGLASVALFSLIFIIGGLLEALTVFSFPFLLIYFLATWDGMGD